MEMSVHGLLFVHVHLAQALVLGQCPVALIGLKVAAVRGIVARRLDELDHAHGFLERLSIARGVEILGQGVDGECLPKDALLGVQGMALEVHHPVDAAELMIPEATGEVLVRALGRGQVNRLAIDAESLREGPQNARIEDEPFGGVRVDGQIVSDLAAKAAVLVVDGVFEPERKDVGEEFVCFPYLTKPVGVGCAVPRPVRTADTRPVK